MTMYDSRSLCMCVFLCIVIEICNLNCKQSARYAASFHPNHNIKLNVQWFVIFQRERRV